MSNATAIHVGNSRAVRGPFAPDSGQPRDSIAEVLRQIDIDRWATSLSRLELNMILSIFEQYGMAASLGWQMQFAGTQSAKSSNDALTIQQAKNEAAIRLLRLWREGGKQEQRETWEYLKRALDEDRLSSRKLFP
jgi:hypothetical protein